MQAKMTLLHLEYMCEFICAWNRNPHELWVVLDIVWRPKLMWIQRLLILEHDQILILEPFLNLLICFTIWPIATLFKLNDKDLGYCWIEVAKNAQRIVNAVKLAIVVVKIGHRTGVHFPKSSSFLRPVHPQFILCAFPRFQGRFPRSFFAFQTPTVCVYFQLSVGGIVCRKLIRIVLCKRKSNVKS